MQQVACSVCVCVCVRERERESMTNDWCSHGDFGAIIVTFIIKC